MGKYQMRRETTHASASLHKPPCRPARELEGLGQREGEKPASVEEAGDDEGVLTHGLESDTEEDGEGKDAEQVGPVVHHLLFVPVRAPVLQPATLPCLSQ